MHGFRSVLSASRFGFVWRGRKQGSRVVLAVTAYQGLPTSDLRSAATHRIGQRGTRRWCHNICATVSLGPVDPSEIFIAT